MPTSISSVPAEKLLETIREKQPRAGRVRLDSVKPAADGNRRGPERRTRTLRRRDAGFVSHVDTRHYRGGARRRHRSGAGPFGIRRPARQHPHGAKRAQPTTTRRAGQRARRRASGTGQQDEPDPLRYHLRAFHLGGASRASNRRHKGAKLAREHAMLWVRGRGWARRP